LKLKELILSAIMILLLLQGFDCFAAGKQVDFLINGMRNNSNTPLTQGKVYSYLAGTTTEKPLYSAADLSTVHPNPAILDVYGRLNAWGAGKYKFIITDKDDETIVTLDGLEYSSLDTFASTTSDPFGDVITFSYANISNLIATLSDNLVCEDYRITGLASGTSSQDAINLGQFLNQGEDILASAAINASEACVVTLASAAINASEACAYTVPTGVIAMWSGTEADVPPGWNLCDGSNGTPDLRGWFIRSSYGVTVPVGSFTSPFVHNFDVTEDDYPCGVETGTGGYATETNSLYPVGTSTENIGSYTQGRVYLGGYYALAYIMKL